MIEPSVSYATVEKASRFIHSVDRGCFLCKTYIQNAFCIIRIRPEDYNLLRMKWQGLYYYDRSLAMGCASVPKTFETVSTAVEWIAYTKLRIDHIMHLLDDFLIIAPSRDLCQTQLQLFLGLCQHLGIRSCHLLGSSSIPLSLRPGFLVTNLKSASTSFRPFFESEKGYPERVANADRFVEFFLFRSRTG